MKFIEIETTGTATHYVAVRDIKRIIFSPENNEYTLVLRDGTTCTAVDDCARELLHGA